LDHHLQKLQDAIAGATQGMNVDRLTWHPDGKWCTTEVLEHLYLTYRGTVKGFERCLEAHKPLARTPTLQDRLRTFVVVGLGYMPRGRKAPERSVPRGMAAEEVVQAMERELAAMDHAIAQCEARFGKTTRVVDHPVLGPLTAEQWRKFHCVHGRHHVKQIWKLRKGDTFH
jgi:hypothetical protein